MDFTNMAIDPAMGIVVIALVAFGYFLKSTPDIPDWMIGWILLVLSIIAGIFKVGANTDGIINGVIAAAIAVYGNSLFKQTMVNRITDRTGETTLTPIDTPKVEVVPITIDPSKVEVAPADAAKITETIADATQSIV